MRKIIITILGAFCLSLTVSSAAEIKYKADPTKVLDPDKSCAECHKPEMNAWQTSHHFLSFNAGVGGKKPMHRSDEAKSILKKLVDAKVLDKRQGRSAKGGICVQCHYTGQASSSGRIRSIAGVSCESCHGAAKDWIETHRKEPKDFAAAEAKGMIRPRNVYAVAANCFTCHTVPYEELINKGGHTAGSAFELVSWSQGEVRHTLRDSEGKLNVAATPERKRELYVVGRLLDLEYSLRALAKATGGGTYADAMTKRVNDALGKVQELEGKGVAAGVAGAVSAGELKAGNEANLTAMADAVSAKSKAAIGSAKWDSLGAIDGLIPTETKGKAYTP